MDRWAVFTEGILRETLRQDTVWLGRLVNASALGSLRKSFSMLGKPRPSWTALVLKALSLALREHPAMNRLLLGGRYRYRPVQLERVDATVAVESPGGDSGMVYGAILRDTDEKSCSRITQELSTLAGPGANDDPRLKQLKRMVHRTPGWLCRLLVSLPRYSPKLWIKHRGGSFALTTVGKYGVDVNYATWPWPLTITMGEVAVRPVAVGRELDARDTFSLSMGYDHRLANGGPAARFFREVVRRIEAADLGEVLPEGACRKKVPRKLAAGTVGAGN